MVPDGPAAHHREALVRQRAERITCTHCGLVHDCSPEQGDDYELWYRARLGDKTVSARNIEHLDTLVTWLSGDIHESELGIGDRADIQALPSWLKERRSEAADRLRALPHD